MQRRIALTLLLFRLATRSHVLSRFELPHEPPRHLKTCPSCNTIRDWDDVVCRSCGERLEKSTTGAQGPVRSPSGSASLRRDPIGARKLAARADSSSSTSGGFLRRATAVTPGYGVLKGVKIRRRVARNVAAPDFSPRAIVQEASSAKRKRVRPGPDVPRASVADAPATRSERVKLPARPTEDPESREELRQFAVGLELSRMTPSARTMFGDPRPASRSASSSDSGAALFGAIPFESSEATRTRNVPQSPVAQLSRPAPEAAEAVDEMFSLDDFGPLDTDPRLDRLPTPSRGMRADSLDYDAMFDTGPMDDVSQSSSRASSKKPDPARPSIQDQLRARREPQARDGISTSSSSSSSRSASTSQKTRKQSSAPVLNTQRGPELAMPIEERLPVVNPVHAAAIEAARQRGIPQPTQGGRRDTEANELARKAALNQTILVGLLAFLLGMAVVWALFV